MGGEQSKLAMNGKAGMAGSQFIQWEACLVLPHLQKQGYPKRTSGGRGRLQATGDITGAGDDTSLGMAGPGAPSRLSLSKLLLFLWSGLLLEGACQKRGKRGGGILDASALRGAKMGLGNDLAGVDGRGGGMM